jgi:hypothetical protein
MSKREEKEQTEEKTITPSQYFDFVKDAKQTITTKALQESYDVFIKLAEKYKKLGQVESMKKLCFLADTLTKEEKLIEMGITTFVYKDVIEDYIENVADKAVKIVELSRYMREIPDELIETVEKSKELFDELYVVFTDYTGREERKVEKERRDKDPILFGVFKNARNVADRFYFLGDWVDEYCDLTLDKMVEQYKEKKGYSPAVTTEIPKTSEELVAMLKSYQIDTNAKNGYIIDLSINDNEVEEGTPIDAYKIVNATTKKVGFFDKVRSIFSKK